MRVHRMQHMGPLPACRINRLRLTASGELVGHWTRAQCVVLMFILLIRLLRAITVLVCPSSCILRLFPNTPINRLTRTLTPQLGLLLVYVVMVCSWPMQLRRLVLSRHM